MPLLLMTTMRPIRKPKPEDEDDKKTKPNAPAADD